MEVLFCRLCILHRDCADIGRQAFQYQGCHIGFFKAKFHKSDFFWREFWELKGNLLGNFGFGFLTKFGSFLAFLGIVSYNCFEMLFKQNLIHISYFCVLFISYFCVLILCIVLCIYAGLLCYLYGDGFAHVVGPFFLIFDCSVICTKRWDGLEWQASLLHEPKSLLLPRVFIPRWRVRIDIGLYSHTWSADHIDRPSKTISDTCLPLVSGGRGVVPLQVLG